MTQTSKQKLVVVGNGMAGMRTVEELLKLNSDLYDITVFGSEPYGNYNRIMLSPVLAAQQTIQDIMINDVDWYERNNITLHTSKTVVEIDKSGQRVVADDGTVAEYDKLLLATGSNPFIIPVPGHQLDGVISYRDIKDVNTMIEYAETKQHAIVIGGGLLGLEAAYGLIQRGMKVRVVHLMDKLMERQLDMTAAKLLQAQMESLGIEFLLEHNTQEITGDENGHVNGIKFANGDEYPADLVVMAVGIKPNTALGVSAELEAERALVVDDFLQTSADNIYAVGECAQHRGIAYGLVAPLFEQAEVCARHLAGFSDKTYEGTQLMTKLKVSGVNLFSAGDFIGDDDCEYLLYNDLSNAVYKKLVIKDNQLVGAVLYGDTVDGSWYFDLINEKCDISAARETLTFGAAFTDQLALSA